MAITRTLAELNAAAAPEAYRYGWTVIRERAVGKQGRRQTGDKVHMLSVTRIVAVEDPEDARRVGGFHHVSARCNANGQFTGSVLKGLDTDAINCERCIRYCTPKGAR